jgi:hypothetical protein
MKRKLYILRQSALGLGLLFLFACKQDKPVKISPSANDKTVVKNTGGTFPFHKDILIKPGLHFEVLSWGKGVDSLGGYLILMSDSAKNNYKSLAVERSGVITDAWNMDMDNDGNPELYIELMSKKKVKDLNVYEYNGGFNKISFPPLSTKMKKIYGGDDQFIQKNGDLFRSFPVVNSSDTTQKKGAVKMLHYSLRGNSFSVDEVKEQE